METVPIIDNYGNTYWYLHGKPHREDGPASEHANGDKEWWLNGKLHREDGPAFEYIDGNKYWYYYNKKIKCKSQEEFEKKIKKLKKVIL
jgi:hypothetical protein